MSKALRKAHKKIKKLQQCLESHHADLLTIHGIAQSVATCPPIVETDHRTVRYVKDMAWLINKLSRRLEEIE